MQIFLLSDKQGMARNISTDCYKGHQTMRLRLITMPLHIKASTTTLLRLTTT